MGDPQTLIEFQAAPEATLKKVEAEVLSVLGQPDRRATNAIWLMIVGALVLVLMGSAFVIFTGVSTELKPNASYAGKIDTVLTVFSTAIGFLAGLLTPSPLVKKGE